MIVFVYMLLIVIVIMKAQVIYLCVEYIKTGDNNRKAL